MRTHLVALAAVVLAMPAFCSAAPSAAAEEKEGPAAPAPRIQLSFKLDPRLSGPTYGGERWVSPPTYRGVMGQDTVEARASTVDRGGRPLKIDVQWTASDPDAVTISPPRGDRVRITAKRAGESVVTVKAGASSRSLTVKAVEANGFRHVSISQGALVAERSEAAR